MKTSSLAASVILLAAASAPASAQIYKWVDGSGQTHYSDTAPSGAKKPDTVAERISLYTPDARVAQAEPAAAATAALSDKVDSLERRLRAEQLARQQIELAAYTPVQAMPADYVSYPVPVAFPVRHRRPFPAQGANVVGPGIVPGTFNGPNAITAGNFTLRTSLPAVRGGGAVAFAPAR
jgi:hypothetical protein